MSPERSTTESAIYAQARRENEKEACEELKKRIPYDKHVSQLALRGDLTQTTKVLVVALLEIDKTAGIPTREERLNYTSARYNLLRRKNEKTICDKLEALILKDILSQDFMRQGSLNPTTKIAVATAKYFDRLQQTAGVRKNQASAQTKMADNHANGNGSEESDNSAQAVDMSSPTSTSSDSTLGLSDPVSHRIRTDGASSPVMGRVLRSASSSGPTVSQAAIRNSVSQHRYPVRGSFTDDYLNLDVRPPPLPSNINGIIAWGRGHYDYSTFSQEIGRDESEEPDPTDHRLKPSRKRQKTFYPHMQEVLPDSPNVELYQSIRQAANELAGEAKAMMEPVQDMELDIDTGEVTDVASVRTVTANEREKAEWVRDLLVDARKTLRCESEFDRIQQKWNGIRDQWQDEGKLSELPPGS